ncbi:MAG: hypothetical protein ACI9SJ_000327 [Flavobacteriaceae bacterium]|jgi:hypothetical protein
MPTTVAAPHPNKTKAKVPNTSAKYFFDEFN